MPRSALGQERLQRDQAADLVAHKTDLRGGAHPRQGDHVIELLHLPLEVEPMHGIADGRPEKVRLWRCLEVSSRA